MKSLMTFFRLVKFEHTIFALPFAFASMFIASNGLPSLHFTIWVVVAMIGARSFAMALNRLADADIDAENPRTAMRDIPAGKVSRQTVRVYIAISAVVFFFAAYQLNTLSLLLSPVPILVFILYSYSKRFTNLCHIVLGIALGLAPIGAWIGVTGEINSAVPFILCFAIMFWVAGFDIMYAIQDIDFDREKGLYSIPSLLGVNGTLILARMFHMLAFGLFLTVKFYGGLGNIYLVGVILTGLFMVYEHSLVSKDDLSKLNLAFFNINAYISVVLCLFTLVDILIRV